SLRHAIRRLVTPALVGRATMLAAHAAKPAEIFAYSAAGGEKILQNACCCKTRQRSCADYAKPGPNRRGFARGSCVPRRPGALPPDPRDIFMKKKEGWMP